MKVVFALSLGLCLIGCGSAQNPAYSSSSAHQSEVPLKHHVKAVTLNDSLNLQGGRNHSAKIHRIRSLTAYSKLGGTSTPVPVDFNTHDLVVIKGVLNCSKGTVSPKVTGETVSFSMETTNICNGPSLLMRHGFFEQFYVIPKQVRIDHRFFIKPQKVVKTHSSLSQALANPHSQHLMLSGLQLTDNQLVPLKRFNYVTHAHLKFNHITDQGVAHLSHMTNLYQLFLGHNTAITDAAIPHLAQIMKSRLQILDITGTNITSKGLEQLRALSKQQNNQYSTQIIHSIVIPVTHQ